MNKKKQIPKKSPSVQMAEERRESLQSKEEKRSHKPGDEKVYAKIKEVIETERMNRDRKAGEAERGKEIERVAEEAERGKEKEREAKEAEGGKEKERQVRGKEQLERKTTSEEEKKPKRKTR